MRQVWLPLEPEAWLVSTFYSSQFYMDNNYRGINMNQLIKLFDTYVHTVKTDSDNAAVGKS